jgi:transposase
MMKRFVEGAARDQGGLFPAHLEDFVDLDNPVRAIDAFVDMLGLREIGFTPVDPSATGRPSYHPASLLKLYIYDGELAQREVLDVCHGKLQELPGGEMLEPR